MRRTMKKRLSRPVADQAEHDHVDLAAVAGEVGRAADKSRCELDAEQRLLLGMQGLTRAQMVEVGGFQTHPREKTRAEEHVAPVRVAEGPERDGRGEVRADRRHVHGRCLHLRWCVAVPLPADVVGAEQKLAGHADEQEDVGEQRGIGMEREAGKSRRDGDERQKRILELQQELARDAIAAGQYLMDIARQQEEPEASRQEQDGLADGGRYREHLCGVAPSDAESKKT